MDMLFKYYCICPRKPLFTNCLKFQVMFKLRLTYVLICVRPVALEQLYSESDVQLLYYILASINI